MILVINRTEPDAFKLKELIEFMDSPSVCVAAPEEWQERLEGHRLEALFVGADLSDTEVSTLLDSVGQLDPNVPIVMMKGGDPT
jgi:DNA-binding NtrC family response regulator